MLMTAGTSSQSHGSVQSAGVTHRSHRVPTAVQPQGAALQLGPEGGVVLDHAGTVDDEQTGW